MERLMRHVEAVQNVTLPGERVPFRLGDEPVGWVLAEAAPLVVAQGFGCHRAGEAVVLPGGEDLPGLALAVGATGAFRWRGEAFDVRGDCDGRVLSTVDRGALPYFGIRGEGVHVNGVVRRADEVFLWVARRAAGRPLDPGKLDHVFAGGIAAGMDPAATLVKEGADEAGFSPEVVARAVYAGSLRYVTLRPEGLRRDRIHCYDLVLPEDVVPAAADGEVEAFALWPVARVIDALRETDLFKFNVALVLIDFLLRWRLLPETGETARLTAIFRK